MAEAGSSPEAIEAALAEEFQCLVRDGFEDGTFADAKVRGAQPAPRKRTLGNAGCRIARNCGSPDGRIRTVPQRNH